MSDVLRRSLPRVVDRGLRGCGRPPAVLSKHGTTPSCFGAIEKLSRHRIRIADAPTIVPQCPGLYAIYGTDTVWETLGVTSTFEHGPLYVGKSENNLLVREVFNHFNASASRKPSTGSSTVRRSLAALLRAELHLRAQPRNPLKPAHFASYGLAGNGDLLLTLWMAENLELALWQKPTTPILSLGEVETVLIRLWDPPLNIDKAPTPRRDLKSRRAALAQEARERADAAQTRSL
jgi:hypothetical protein